MESAEPAIAELRRIDHIVVAVRNLEEAGNFYRRLGFQVGTRNQHPWGTENRLIQFGSSFVELITVGENAHLIPPHEARRFSFGAFIRDHLEGREGLAMLVLSSNNAQEDAALFAQSGIGNFETFSFERTGVKPDGAPTRVAFSLAFARDSAAPNVGFFVCQQHTPENFWDSRFQHHANGAKNITAVTLTTSASERHLRFFTAFTGANAEYDPSGKYRFALNGGRIDLCPDMQIREPLLPSFTIQVDDTAATARLLVTEKIPFTDSNGTLVVPNAYASGAEIRFEAATASLHGPRAYTRG